MGCLTIFAFAVVGWVALGPLGAIIALLAAIALMGAANKS